ncbi:MAG: hypothetical protein MUO31_16315 [Thermodesulfovibrionales bacterium]|nr:hypothetical protein [Thermodesulfovibrionales bacterium]
MIKVISKKSAIPSLWIDTSIISKIARIQLGLPMNPQDMDRSGRLFELLKNKTISKKILCPQGDQEEEIKLYIPSSYDHGQFLLKCHEIQLKLSHGSSFKHRKEIEAIQRQQFMSAFTKNICNIEIDFLDVFIPSTKTEFFGTNLINDIPPSGKMTDLSSLQALKDSYYSLLETARQQNVADGLTYEEELIKEYQGLIQATAVVFENYQKTGDFSQVNHFLQPLKEWENINSDSDDIAGLRKFLFSEHYKSIPNVEIESKLYAKILTGPKIEIGDSMDINHLATMIPYNNFIIADNKMKNLVIELKIDKKYGARIFSIKDYDEIEKVLSKI